VLVATLTAAHITALQSCGPSPGQAVSGGNGGVATAYAELEDAQWTFSC